MSEQIDARLEVIGRQRFRQRFHLRGPELAIVRTRGLPTVRSQARELVHARLSAATPYRDGRQTPYRGHPVFVAQHATATCCRTCLERWHAVPQGEELTREQHGYVVDVLCRWVERALDHGPPN